MAIWLSLLLVVLLVSALNLNMHTITGVVTWLQFLIQEYLSGRLIFVPSAACRYKPK